MEQINESQIGAVGLQEASPPYLKLIVDCWEHIFDNLSLLDIISMSKTCKRMNQLAGYYIGEYLPPFAATLTEEGCEKVYYGSNATNLFQHICLQPEFHQFIKVLTVDRKSYSSACSQAVPALPSLKTIKFYCEDFPQIFVNTQHFSTNVETVFLNSCSIGDATFEQIGKYFPKMRELHLSTSRASVRIFSHYYPSLASLTYQTYKTEAQNLITQTYELKAFLQKHSKLKRLKCDYDFLWANRDLLIQTNIELNTLAIHCGNSSIGTPSFDHFLNYLKTLYARGFYKTLHLSLNTKQSLSISTLLAMPSLETLRCDYLPTELHISRLTNLKELHLVFLRIDEKYMEMLAKSLINLERLTIQHQPSRHILPFIRYSKKLETFHFGGIGGGLDLFALNEERKKLANSHRISLHLIEKDYLATKWKAKFTSFSHIKIYRQFIELL